MGHRVGLIYDDRMCNHISPDADHPENPNRIQAIWKRLNESGLVQRCVVLDAKKAEDNHLALVHFKEHIDLIKTISSKSFPTMSKTADKFDSIYFNRGSSTSAYLAAACRLCYRERVAKGELDSSFAVVRPPGHHAEQDKPMGFCLCNNVAIATSFLLNERPELGMRKILIVDWDIHHGNGTQKMFYKDPRVLVFSVHRHESGRFYPHSNDGSYDMTGEGPGSGYNINVPWENGGCGDADYIAVWDHILIPIAKEFDPDMIIISAGFDAAKGDPIGGCFVSPYGYTVMLNKLMGFGRGKIVMALEGGYNSVSLANSAQSCIEVLLQDKPVMSSLEDVPLKSTWCVIRTVRQALCGYWPALAATLPDKSTNRRPSQIEADAAIQAEVDFSEKANEKPPNEAIMVENARVPHYKVDDDGKGVEKRDASSKRPSYSMQWFLKYLMAKKRRRETIADSSLKATDTSSSPTHAEPFRPPPPLVEDETPKVTWSKTAVEILHSILRARMVEKQSYQLEDLFARVHLQADLAFHSVLLQKLQVDNHIKDALRLIAESPIGPVVFKDPTQPESGPLHEALIRTTKEIINVFEKTKLEHKEAMNKQLRQQEELINKAREEEWSLIKKMYEVELPTLRRQAVLDFCNSGSFKKIMAGMAAARAISYFYLCIEQFKYLKILPADFADDRLDPSKTADLQDVPDEEDETEPDEFEPILQYYLSTLEEVDDAPTNP